MLERIEASLLTQLETVLALYGKQGEWWDYYETDPNWWVLRLWTRRN